MASPTIMLNAPQQHHPSISLSSHTPPSLSPHQILHPRRFPSRCHIKPSMASSTIILQTPEHHHPSISLSTHAPPSLSPSQILHPRRFPSRCHIKPSMASSTIMPKAPQRYHPSISLSSHAPPSLSPPQIFHPRRFPSRRHIQPSMASSTTIMLKAPEHHHPSISLSSHASSSLSPPQILHPRRFPSRRHIKPFMASSTTIILQAPEQHHPSISLSSHAPPSLSPPQIIHPRRFPSRRHIKPSMASSTTNILQAPEQHHPSISLSSHAPPSLSPPQILHPRMWTHCNSLTVEGAFDGEEEELLALLKVAVETKDKDKVYYAMQRLRGVKGGVSEETGEVIERWFKSSVAGRMGKRNWDEERVKKAVASGGGGWHGLGWLGRGNWAVNRAFVGGDGVCGRCGERLVALDLDPVETESFARSVADVALKRESNSTIQQFQKWLDYHGPFEAVIDAANVGLYSRRTFSLSKVNRVGNAIRHKIASKKWPLIVVHNRRINEKEVKDPRTTKLIEKLRDLDAIYATPTGSNDDWYWLYAAIKCRCLIVTNDEMRDHTFQLLGNDVFPKWKERHQVHFTFRDDGNPEIIMPPPYTTVIQESEKGHWHVPISQEHDPAAPTVWLCITRDVRVKDEEKGNPENPKNGVGRSRHGNAEDQHPKILRRSCGRPLAGVLFDLEIAEKNHGCVIDFQI
ncbi:uncharacterized protein LOC144709242 isoform X2 [Wolffia australiana]